jgi:hypothetical protein
MSIILTNYPGITSEVNRLQYQIEELSREIGHWQKNNDSQ